MRSCIESHRASSIIIRIKTRRQWLSARLHQLIELVPLQQGLRHGDSGFLQDCISSQSQFHYNKDQDLIGLAFAVRNQYLIELVPLQQGLRLWHVQTIELRRLLIELVPLQQGLRHIYSNPFSTNEGLIELVPLQQGLRQLLQCQTALAVLSFILNSSLIELVPLQQGLRQLKHLQQLDPTNLIELVPLQQGLRRRQTLYG
ncbi:MAG: hypothetical protein EZS28_050743, partial [Streblomastix strix]